RDLPSGDDPGGTDFSRSSMLSLGKLDRLKSVPPGHPLLRTMDRLCEMLRGVAPRSPRSGHDQSFVRHRLGREDDGRMAGDQPASLSLDGPDTVAAVAR